MPELPEVETVRRGLAHSLEGARILSVETRRAGLRYPFPENLDSKLEGKMITAVERRAKYLLIVLDDDIILISHLGMSGSWRVEETGEGGEQPRKHDHLLVNVMQKGENLRLTYHDPRRFGFILLASKAGLSHHPKLKDLGVEPLGNEFSPAMLAQAFAHRKKSLKSALLDQRIVVGLGNIYVCEALWQAHLSPFLPAEQLSQQESAMMGLVNAIRDVLRRALQAGGSSLRDYAHIDGTSGYFQHQFHVYGRENAPCPRCHAPILRDRQSGRSTFYCAACQPLNPDGR